MRSGAAFNSYNCFPHCVMVAPSSAPASSTDSGSLAIMDGGIASYVSLQNYLDLKIVLLLNKHILLALFESKMSATAFVQSVGHEARSLLSECVDWNLYAVFTLFGYAVFNAEY
jgi:hypothetical protein